ncbi:MAG: glycosyltransferase [Acidobacteriota bacterium]|nr:glycosyltransferase [Acidobacteriota bacterium]
MHKVSIVISNHNYAAFLEAAIKSALAQAYDACEVIVVDDGSTDGSAEILERYSDRVQVWLIAHQGETATRNFGFSKCTGDLICFLDSDDGLYVDAAERIVKFWRPEFAKAQYSLRVVDQEGIDQRLLMPRCRLDSGNVLPSLLRTGRYITSPGSGNFYARSFLDSIMPVPTNEWPQSFDSYAAACAGFWGEVGAIQEPLGYYRVHRNNMTRSVRSGAFEDAQINRLLQRQLRLRKHVLAIAAREGLQPQPDIVISHWLYLKLELVRQRGAPLREILRIVRKMTTSVSSAPELGAARRIQLIGWAIASVILPKALSQYIMALGFDIAPESRLARTMRRL